MKRGLPLSALYLGVMGLLLSSCTQPDSTTQSTTSTALGATTGAPQTAAVSNPTPQQVAAPTFSPPSGAYSSTQTVTISSSTQGATIRYTTDGSAPTEAVGTVATASVSVATSETLKAIAYEAGSADSTVTTGTYVINDATGKVSAPTFNPPGGTYASGLSVAIACPTSDATIYYTTDGSIPTSSSAVYSNSISLEGDGTTTTVRAIATRAGRTYSEVETAAYTTYADWEALGSFGKDVDQLEYPTGVAVDAQGRVLIADRGNARIVYASADPGVGWTAYAGNGTTRLRHPDGVALDVENRIYVADQGNHRIVRMDDTDGTGWAAFGGHGSGGDALFSPAGVAVDARARIYVVDQGSSRVIRMDGMDGSGWTVFGERGSGVNQFKDPAGIALDSEGRIYVADYGNSRIVRFDDMNGSNWTAFGNPGVGAGQFKYPAGIAVDASGRIFVADMSNDRIDRLDDMSGTNWTTFAPGFSHPWGVCLDAGGHVYVADMLNSRIVRTTMR